MLKTPGTRSQTRGAASRTESWLARDRAAISPAYFRYTDIVAVRGEGSFLYDVEGRRYLDLTSGIAVTSLGHSHPRVIGAAREQLETLAHVSVTAHHELNIRLAERLQQVTGLDLSFFANSGAEVVDGALKLARRVTGRSEIIAFEGAFHGRTMGATSLSSSKQHYREGYAPLLPGIHAVPYPAPDATADEVVQATSAALSALFAETSPATIAAILVEPVLGEGGYVAPAPAFMRLLREVASAHGILLVADEVQSGLGRTGRWLAVEHAGVVPDVVLLAKALASGLPLGAIVGRLEVMEAWPPAAHGSTFGGNPVACAAALATLDVIGEEGLVARAETLGKATLESLRRDLADHPAVADVRGLGLMIGIELRAHRGWNTAAAAQERVRRLCLESDVMVISCGRHDEVIRLMPPLNVDEEDLARGVEVLIDAVRSL